MEKISIILFNLGGPDKPSSVKPFLYNLFNDPAIIRLPYISRKIIAWMISTLRAPKAIKIYEHLGGGSPIVANTKLQADELAKVLHQSNNNEFQVLVAMRYWHPFSEEAVKAVKAFNPSTVVLLPLYPQFSTTTSDSSIKEWKRIAKANNLDVNTKLVCCYPEHIGFIKAYAELTLPVVSNAVDKHEKVRVLFSAHGLPQKIVDQGDPYQWQVEQTVASLWKVMGVNNSNVNYTITYQSRVGPMKWIGPSTEEEIKRSGELGEAVVLVPISFVSEHSETLVELDCEYKLLAQEVGVPGYFRVPTVNTHISFITALKDLCLDAIKEEGGIVPSKALCPDGYSHCYCRKNLV